MGLKNLPPWCNRVSRTSFHSASNGNAPRSPSRRARSRKRQAAWAQPRGGTRAPRPEAPPADTVDQRRSTAHAVPQPASDSHSARQSTAVPAAAGRGRPPRHRLVQISESWTDGDEVPGRDEVAPECESTGESRALRSTWENNLGSVECLGRAQPGVGAGVLVCGSEWRPPSRMTASRAARGGMNAAR